jgi:hypothetical protein
MGIVSLEFSIFNRWGERVFTGHSLSDRWDGRVNEGPAEAGVYAIVLKALFLDGEVTEKRGSVALYR